MNKRHLWHCPCQQLIEEDEVVYIHSINTDWAAGGRTGDKKSTLFSSCKHLQQSKANNRIPWFKLCLIWLSLHTSAVSSYASVGCGTTHISAVCPLLQIMTPFQIQSQTEWSGAGTRPESQRSRLEVAGQQHIDFWALIMAGARYWVLLEVRSGVTPLLMWRSSTLLKQSVCLPLVLSL